MSDGTIFSLNDISFSYADSRVLRNISLQINGGEIVGVIGPNGSGKSTLLKILAGFLKPRAGNLLFRGKPMEEYRPREIARYIGTLPQQLDVPFSYTVHDFILMGRYTSVRRMGSYDKLDHAIISGAMEEMGIVHLTSRDIRTLSEGERQKVFIAQCVVQEPEVMLLDEPVSHLDIKHQMRTLEFLESLGRKGITILVVLHDLNLAAEFCTRVIMLAAGAVWAEGTPEEVLTYENIERVYDTVVLVRENPVSKKPFVVPVSKNYL